MFQRDRYSMALLLIALLSIGRAEALDYCPFCPTQGQTLVKEVEQARFVILGVPSNPQIRRDADGREFGTTDFAIEEVVKNDPFLKNRKRLTLPRYIPPAGNGGEKLLVFCDLNNDQFDSYLTMNVKNGEVTKYLKEAIKLNDKDITKRLKFFFGYLDHFDYEVSSDAYKEFAKADYADVVKLVKEVGDAEMRKRLIAWMKDSNTSLYRYGLFGLMLGLFGNKEDGEVFLSILNDPDKSLVAGIDGILAGYVLVDSTAGWKYAKALVVNTSSDFSKRHSALKTIRFLWETHIGQVSKEELRDAMEQFASQGDIADLAIDNLRRWKEWKFTDRILQLSKKETHLGAIVQRAILRYMLSCPHNEFPKAAVYVEEMRKKNPERVKDAQEILDLEKSSETEAAKVK